VVPEGYEDVTTFWIVRTSDASEQSMVPEFTI
jgi:hypothetical protein